MLETFITQLAEELELQEIPQKNDQGDLEFSINQEMKILIRELEKGFFFLSKIISCPMQKREELFILLMKANFLGQGTQGNVIALDSEEIFLTLSSSLTYEMNYRKFKECIEDFANYVDYWKEEIVRLTQTSSLLF